MRSRPSFFLTDPAFIRSALRRKDLLNFLFDNRFLRSFRNRDFFHDQSFRLIEHLPFAERQIFRVTKEE